nr:hypothetical protein [Tanacetum cinerariifolium]
MGQLAKEVHKREAGKLLSYPDLNPKHKPGGPEHVNMVTSLRNGKTYNNDIKIPGVHDFSHDVQDFVTDDEIVVEDKKDDNMKSDSDLVNDLLKDFPKPPTQNPKATESPKVGEVGPHSEDMWETFKEVKINLPLIDAIKQIPAYAKFLKDLCTQKRKLKATLPKKIDLTEHVSAVLSSSLPPKFKDPKAPLISVVVGNITIKKALLDLHASILEDVIMKVDDFYYPVDFFVMDTETPYKDVQPNIILGRPFLATIDARINCQTEFLLSLEETPLQSQQVQQPTLNEVQEYFDCLLVQQDVLLGARGSNKDFFLGTSKGKLGRHNIHKRHVSPVHVTGDDFVLGNLKFVPKGEKDEVFGNPILKELITEAIQQSPYYQQYLEMAARKPTDKEEKTTKASPKKKIRKGKVAKVQKGKSPLQLVDEQEQVQPEHEPQRRTPVTEESFTGHSAQPQDDTSANIVCDTPSLTNAKTGADTEKTDSENATEILDVGEEQGEDVSNKVALEEKTNELVIGQAGSDPGKTPESQTPPKHVLMEEDQAGPNLGQSHVALAGPNPEPIHEDFMATVYPKVHESLKRTTEKHVHIENSPNSFGTLSSMKNLDDAFIVGDQFLNDKSTEEEPRKDNVETEVKSMVTVPIPFQQFILSPLPLSIPHLQNQYHLLYKHQSLQIEKQVNEVDKEAVHDALQAPILECFRELSELLRLMGYDNKEEFPEATAKSRKRSPSSSSKQKQASQSEQPVDDVPIPDDVHISDSENTCDAHLPKIKTRPDWLKPVPKEEIPKTPKADWVTGDMGFFIKWYYKQIGKKKLSKAGLEGPAFKVDLMNPEGNRVVRDVSKPLPLGGPPSHVTIQAHYFFNRDLEYVVSGDKEIRHALSISKMKAAYYPDFGLEELVPSHMRILSVISLKTFSRYGYTFLREIVLRRAYYKEHKISKADFKNLHPNDFEDLYVLHLQGKLNHLSSTDKVHQFNLVNLWIRNLVIRHRVEDLQLGIKSYQTKLNLTQWSWDASDFQFKEDYTIVQKTMAVIYKDRNNQKKMMT